MMNQYFLEKAELQSNFPPEMPLREIFEKLRKELASQHKVMVRCLINNEFFENEMSTSFDQSVHQTERIGYEVIAVLSVVEDIVSEWEAVLQKLLKRTHRIRAVKRNLDLGWVKKETANMKQTTEDLFDSYDSLKCYFGDSLLAPYVQIDQSDVKMKLLMDRLFECIDQQDTKAWKKIVQTEFVEMVELWQAFFYGIRRVFF